MPTFKDITDDRELCDQYWEAKLLWYSFPITEDAFGKHTKWERDNNFSTDLTPSEWEFEKPSNKRYHRIKYAILLED